MAGMDDFQSFADDLERFAEDSFIQAALSQGVDLKGYSRQIDEELRQVEVESVAGYVGQSEEVVDLHIQMQSCDNILKRMQEMLLGFQADLVGISDEIKHLQAESLSMNVKLRNRRAVESSLKDFLENVVIPPDMVSSICGGEVNDAYLEYVVMLNSKIQYSQKQVDSSTTNSLSPIDTLAGKEVLPELEKLRIRAVSKAREYMLLKIGELRKPKTNIQMLQKVGLVKYHHLMDFLIKTSPSIAQEIRTTYTESMSKTLHSLFKSYHNQLSKLEVEVGSKQEMMCVEETNSATRTLFQKNMSKKGDAFCLGDRINVLTDIDGEPPILVHVALAEENLYSYEAIFRSEMKHMMDAATNEYLFGMDFFKDRSFNTFNQIFGRTISLLLENLENYLFSCYDAIGLLLMIKIVHSQRLTMQRRRIPVLDSVFDRINMLLWPRLKLVLDTNLKSVDNANARRLGTISKNPHYVTRRYAEFTASILALHGGMESLGIAGGGEDMLLNDLTKLRVGVLSLLKRLSEELPSPKQKIVFLINNYDQVLSVFHERQIIGDESGRFEELLSQYRCNFVEEELLESFSNLISFVQHTESNIQAGDDAGCDVNMMENLVLDFSNSWKSAIEIIYQNVLEYFSNFRNGMEILKQVLTQLLLYYTRFQDIIRKVWGRRQPPFAKDIVSTATILVEIKKYSRAL